MKDFSGKYIEIEGYAGSLGAAFLYDENPERIDTLFRPDYVKNGRASLEDGRDLPLCDEGVIAEINRVCRDEKCGYQLFLRKIPVKQFAIEVCEQYQKSPYDLPFHGRVILRERETPASCGYTTQALAKILIR